MTPAFFHSDKGDAVLSLYVQPKAAQTEWAGLHAGALKIRVAAPPVDGAANEALTRFLARELSLPLTAVTIESGIGSRKKRVSFRGLRPSELEAYLIKKRLAAT